MAFGQELSTTRSSKLSYFPIATSKRPIEIFSSILDKFETAFILESVEGPRRLARYTFLGFQPTKLIRASRGHVETSDNRTRERRIATYEDPFRILAECNPLDRGLDLNERYGGGLVGYASYD